MTLLARTVALHRAAGQWEDRAEELHGARTTLGDADPSLLGDRVAGAAQAFLDTWRREIDRLHREAEGHVTALRGAAADLDQADTGSADDLRHLMAWDDRTATADGGAR